MDFGKFNKELDKEIEKLLNDWRNEVKKISRALLPLVDKFIEGCQGGKRLRGNLVVLGYELGKESSVVSRQSSDKDKKSLTADSEAILKAESSIFKVAAAYEIFHSAILAHDDIIDQSPIRRGQPSLYKAVGIEQAITLADLGFFLAIKIIAESNFPEKNEALELFSKTMVDTAIGQMLDIQKGLPAGRQGDRVTIMKLKTARYTVAGPLQLGAVLAGAEGQLIRELGKFGENLGIAFQIKDDILDGQAKSKDLANALKYMDKARSIIPKLTKEAKMRKVLNELADYMVERSK